MKEDKVTVREFDNRLYMWHRYSQKKFKTKRLRKKQISVLKGIQNKMLKKMRAKHFASNIGIGFSGELSEAEVLGLNISMLANTPIHVDGQMTYEV
jgi:hypothetical protein